MRTSVTIASLTAGAFAVVMIAASGPVTAEGSNFAPIKDAAAIKECSACHMPYPAGLLPARSWAAVMAGLKDHFGENAELDAATARRIGDYLAANAADSRGTRASVKPGAQQAPVPLRITELAWWQQKHRGRTIAPATLTRRGAKLKSDCVACHTGAARGFFDDD